MEIVEKLAMLYLKQQDIANMTPESLTELYLEVSGRINAALKKARREQASGKGGRVG